MDQRALSTVLLRLLGIVFIYAVVLQISQGYLLSQGFSVMNTDSEWGGAYMRIITISLVAQAALGFLFCLSSRRISSLLFKENDRIVLEGRIDGSAMLSVGIGLIGIYLLVTNIPSLLESVVRWLKLQASPPPIGYEPMYGFLTLHSAILVVAALVLIAKRKAICRAMDGGRGGS